MISTKKLRVLVVDDTIVYRKAVSDILKEIRGIEVVGVAHNGQIALSKIKTLKPDLITLDVEMPVMNGIEVLEAIQKNKYETGAIMLSTLTSDGSQMTMRALELGAFDFILKPQTKSTEESKREIKAILEPILKAFAQSKIGPKLLRKKPVAFEKKPLSQPPSVATKHATVPRKQFKGIQSKSEIVVIGISTGGPNALSQMLPKLPGNLGVPVLIVQHMPPVFTKSLASSLDKKCALSVKEADNGEILQDNTVYIAPGGKQMKLAAKADGTNRMIKITNDPPENSCKPAVDYLFRSVADYYVGRTTAVIMTGMGSDGTKGLQILKEKGAHVIAQDEASCVVYGMPKAPIDLGLADTIAPLDRIADAIIKTTK
jgi:two-component system chemotaxis response regulator CheB